MQFKSVLAIATFSVCIMLSACNNEDSSAVTQNNQDQKLKLQPIVIQGALPVESERMASKLIKFQLKRLGAGNSGKALIMVIQ
jgi:adenosylhomocysteine nucleosidase